MNRGPIGHFTGDVRHLCVPAPDDHTDERRQRERIGKTHGTFAPAPRQRTPCPPSGPTLLPSCSGPG